MSNESFGNLQPAEALEKRLPEPLQRLFSRLSASDIAQFNSAYQLWTLHQQIDLLYLQIALTRQEIQLNSEQLHLAQPTALELSTLAQLQANGVDDVDLLDRLHARGEAWLDHAIQLLAHCERMDLIQGDYTQWCEHALEGAYDWISSIDDDDLTSAENQHEQPATPAPTPTTSSANYDEEAEAMLLRKLFTEAGEDIPEEIEPPSLPTTLPDLSAYATVPAHAPSHDDTPGELPLEDIAAKILSHDDTIEEVSPLEDIAVETPSHDNTTEDASSHDDPAEETLPHAAITTGALPHDGTTEDASSHDNTTKEVSPQDNITVEVPSHNDTHDTITVDAPSHDDTHDTITVDAPSHDDTTLKFHSHTSAAVADSPYNDLTEEILPYDKPTEELPLYADSPYNDLTDEILPYDKPTEELPLYTANSDDEEQSYLDVATLPDLPSLSLQQDRSTSTTEQTAPPALTTPEIPASDADQAGAQEEENNNDTTMTFKRVETAPAEETSPVTLAEEPVDIPQETPAEEPTNISPKAPDQEPITHLQESSSEEPVSIPQESPDEKPIFSDRDAPGPPPLLAEKLLRAQDERESLYALPMKRTSLVSRMIGFFFPKS
ncbi:MAG TPA: hypothetical protein VGN34_07600 [Ktedonobacteraceae bacterium]